MLAADGGSDSMPTTGSASRELINADDAFSALFALLLLTSESVDPPTPSALCNDVNDGAGQSGDEGIAFKGR